MESRKVDIYAYDGSSTLILRIKNVDTIQQAIKTFETILACPSDFDITRIDILGAEAQPQQKD